MADTHVQHGKDVVSERVYRAHLRYGKDSAEDADVFCASEDRCSVIALGPSSSSGIASGAEGAARVGIWAFSHIRKRPFYQDDTRLLMRRVIKTVNLHLYRMGRQNNEKPKICTSFALFATGARKRWVVCAGNAYVYSVSDGQVDVIVQSQKPDAMGLSKRVPSYEFVSKPLAAVNSFIYFSDISCIKNPVVFCREVSSPRVSCDGDLMNVLSGALKHHAGGTEKGFSVFVLRFDVHEKDTLVIA